jgi:hypothetical protein
MQIRTQVYCFVVFMVTLLTASLVHSQAAGDEAPEPAATTADLGDFYAAVGEQFGVSATEVERLANEGGLPPAQVLVVHFLAQQSMRHATDVLAERKSGKGWRQIAMASQLRPDLFYQPLPREDRKLFSNVYALFEQQPRSRWSWETLPLGDREIEQLVGLRFVADVAGEDTPRANGLHGEGADLVTLHHFLLSGQRTASLAERAGEAIRS